MTRAISPLAPAPQHDDDSLDRAAALAERLCQRLSARVLGRDPVVRALVVALLADGHVLLEDLPGSGKTTLARTLGSAIRSEVSPRPDAPALAPFRRIQFTADLLPSDLTGVSIFDTARALFRFEAGPLFAHTILADEINRASPRAQSALLEAMGEKQVSVDNRTWELDEFFFVIATQNPLDHLGTYPLPAAQLDRFLFRLELGAISPERERAVLDQHAAAEQGPGPREAPPCAERAELLAARRAIRRSVDIPDAVKSALVELANGLRADARLQVGASTRALVALLPALQAHALLDGRDCVGPDDLAALGESALAHRAVPAPGTEDAGEAIADALDAAIERLSRPRRRPWSRA